MLASTMTNVWKRIVAGLTVGIFTLQVAAQTYPQGACTAVPESRTCVDSTPCKTDSSGAAVCLEGNVPPSGGFTIPQTCWQYSYRYVCSDGVSSTCGPLQTNPACGLQSSSCVTPSETPGGCYSWNYTYRCETRPAQTTQTLSCSSGLFDTSGFTTPPNNNETFINAAIASETLRQSGAYSREGTEIFKGVPESCRVGSLGVHNCCKTQVVEGTKNSEVQSAVYSLAWSGIKYVGQEAVEMASPYVYDALYTVSAWTSELYAEIIGNQLTAEAANLIQAGEALEAAETVETASNAANASTAASGGFSFGMYGFTYHTGAYTAGSGWFGADICLIGACSASAGAAVAAGGEAAAGGAAGGGAAAGGAVGGEVAVGGGAAAGGAVGGGAAGGGAAAGAGAAAGGEVAAGGAATSTGYVSFNPYVFMAIMFYMVFTGATACTREEAMLALHKGANLSHFLRETCSENVGSQCFMRRYSYCSFNSVLAKIINTQGKPQLGMDVSDCSGFTVEQLSQIDFTRIDFSEFTAAIAERAAAGAPSSSNMNTNYTPVMESSNRGTSQRPTSPVLPTYTGP